MKFLFYIARVGLFRKLPLQTAHSSDEVILWRSVIDMAVHDVGSKKPKKRREAINWFSLENPDFIEVCTLAMLDPVEVKKLFDTKLKNYAMYNKRLR